MPSAPQYQNVFRINKPDSANTSNGGQGIATKAKRNRQPLSCNACRMRKLKCDRQSPCTPCSKKGEAAAASCNYSKASRDGGNVPNRGSASSRSEAQLRLQKLEEMVTGLMQASSRSITNTSSPSSATIDQRMKELSVSLQSSPRDSEPASNGHLDSNGLERNYQGATHWTTILENIRDIQGFLDPSLHFSEDSPPSNLSEAPDIVFEATQPLALNDFLVALPDKPVVDRLVSVYFTSDVLRAPMIHSRKFLREYQAFWADPASTSFLWLSMLFSILWTSSLMETLQSAPFSSDNVFLIKAGQALVAGGYQKARPYSVDATLLYALCNYHLSRDGADTDAWMIMGIATRLAVKMGYHRDPSHLANISPFEGEMRRRCFFLLETFDVLLSIQYGLPAIIQEEECDTEPPRNLLDGDFDEDCKVLPPSRPSTDSTPMLYFCYKSRFAKAHKRAIRHALTLKTTSYDETLKLDAELHANDADTPPSLRMTSLDGLLLDQPYHIMRRTHIKFQYLQSLCVLHRKYLSQDRMNPAFAYSRKTCTDAALQLLRYQADLYFASQPGGRFHKHRAIRSTLIQHHFLLAAMIMCLDMYECHSKRLLSSPSDLEAQATKYDALRLSHEVWMSSREDSRDAERASKVLAIMLSRIPRPNVSVKSMDSAASTLSEIPQNSTDKMSLAGPNTSALTGSSWHTNTFSMCGQDPLIENSPVVPLDATNPLNLIFDGSDIDWGVLDQYLVEGNGDTEDLWNWQALEYS